MQVTKGKAAENPPAAHDRCKNADPEKARDPVEPVEGVQTGSQGLGYLKDAGRAGNTGRQKRGR